MPGARCGGAAGFGGSGWGSGLPAPIQVWRSSKAWSAARRQLSLVTGLVESGRVTLQLIPMDTPPHPGTSGPFKLITTKSLPDVMFAESAREGQIVTNTTETANWRMQFAALQSAAMGPEATLTRLKAELRKLDDE